MFKLIVSFSILSSTCRGGVGNYTLMTVITEGCFEKDMLKDDLKDNPDRCYPFCGSTSHECLRVHESYSLETTAKVNASYCRQSGNEENYVEISRVSNMSTPKGEAVGEDTYKIDYCRQVLGTQNVFHGMIAESEIGQTEFYTLCDIPRQEQPAIFNISFNKWCDAQAYCINRHDGYLAKGIQAKQCEEVKNILKDKYNTATFWTGERPYREHETNNGYTIYHETNKNTGTSEREKRLWWIILLVTILAVFVITTFFLNIYSKMKGKEMAHTNAPESNSRELSELTATVVENASDVSKEELPGPNERCRNTDAEDTLKFTFHPIESSEDGGVQCFRTTCRNKRP